MAYRYTACGTLEISARHVETVCRILERKGIGFSREGNQLTIKHEERTPSTTHTRVEAPFEEIAPYIEQPQSLQVTSELLGDNEVGFVNGRIKTDTREKVWAKDGEAPTPDRLVQALKDRGIAAQITKVKGSRKSGRRSRMFEIAPGSGGPACQVTIKRRFWDSYDLLSVPDVYQPLCRKYHISPDKLREDLHAAKFGVEVRNPALGGPSSEMLFDNLLEIIEEQTEGIRTELG
ncbi:MAG: hypothetical protein AB7N76_02140 [Planctomycetota bacterium]